jgi:hypothetical protein
MKLRLGAIVLLCLAHASGAADLYQSTGRNGSVEISDNAPGMPRVEPIYLDAAFERANLQLDLAERAFALARKTVSAKPAPGHYTAARMSRSEFELIAFYERNVVSTRQVLAGVVQQKRLAATRAVLAIETPAFHP